MFRPITTMFQVITIHQVAVEETNNMMPHVHYVMDLASADIVQDAGNTEIHMTEISTIVQHVKEAGDVARVEGKDILSSIVENRNQPTRLENRN